MRKTTEGAYNISDSIIKQKINNLKKVDSILIINIFYNILTLEMLMFSSLSVDYHICY